MSRGFAGGLAEGLNQGMQMYALHESIKSRAKADERADASAAREEEAHGAKMKEISDVRNMTQQWAQELGWKPPQAMGGPTRPNAPSFGAPGQMPDTPSAIGLGGPPPIAATPSAGALQPSPAAQPQQQPMSPGEYIQQQVWQGDAFSNPEKLNKLAAIAFANNQGTMGIQFLNQVHTATKNGWTKALASLVSGDGKSAAQILKSNGMDIRGEMTPVEGKEHTWKANIGGQEREISAQSLFMSANPEEAYKMQAIAKEKAAEREMAERKFKLEERKQANDDQDQLNKNRRTTAEIGLLNERGALARAKAKEASEKPGLKSTSSSAKDIGTAISRRDSQFKELATVRDEDGEERVDRALKAKYDDAAASLQSFIEDETGEELSHRQLHKVTDEILRFPIDGTPQEKSAALRRALRRFDIDVPEDEKKETKPEALPSRTAEKPKPAAAAPLKKDSSADPEKVAEAYSGTKYHEQMLSVQRALKAPNLSPEQRANLALKANKIAADYEKEYGKKNK